MKRLLALLLVSGLAACQTVETTQPGVVGVNRQQQMLVSESDVRQSAVKAYDEVIAKAKSEGKLDKDPAQVERVRNVVHRLIPATAAFRKDAPSWPWEVNVISSPEVNAWAMPGGKIAVYTGLLEKLQPTDAQLAAVLGHEIAHALREHGREQVSRQMAEGTALAVLGALTGASKQTMDLSQTLLDVTYNLPHSRTQEEEADRIGVELAARAGYDPEAAVTLWEKMEKVGGSQPPQFLSTHPSYKSRIADLKKYAAQVMPLYRKAKS